MTGRSADQFKLPDRAPVPTQTRVKVLALSGGGYRGLFTASIIEALERKLNEDRPQPMPFGRHFDLIAGTSIGGILAAALSYGATGSSIRKLLEEQGKAIFPPLRLRGLRKLIGEAPYNPEHLKAAIRRLIPDAEDLLIGRHAHPLVLTTVNWTSSQLQLLGSQATNVRDDLGLTLMDAMLATSAAPAHFPAHEFEHHLFVDGGLAANAPDVLALRCAQRIRPGLDVQMLSIGTANPLHGRDPSRVPKRGIGWAKPAIELTMHVQELLAVKQCEEELGESRYLRLNSAPSASQVKHVELDVVSDTSTKILRALADDCLESLSKEQKERLVSITQ